MKNKKNVISKPQVNLSKNGSNLNAQNPVFLPIKYNGNEIPVKALTDLTIHVTYDMSIFKKCPYNRDKDEKNRKDIHKSVIRDGWIIPIVQCNNKMEILIGQHIVDEAEIIGAPVYYVIREDLNPEELVALETGKRWTDRNALKAYADNGNQVAKDILKFYDSISLSLKKRKNTHKKVTIAQFLAILYKNPDYLSGLRCNGGITLFKTLKPYESAAKASVNILKTVDIISYAQKNCMLKGIKRLNVLVALTKFIYNDDSPIDLDRLRDKLEYYKFELCGTVNDYYKQIESHYK